VTQWPLPPGGPGGPGEPSEADAAKVPVDLLPPWLVDLVDGHVSPEWEPVVAATRRAAQDIQQAESDRLTVPSGLLPADRTYALAYAGLRRWYRYRELRASYRRRLEQEKLQSLYQFAYGAGHEINNPLTNITLRADALLRAEADPRRRRLLETIRTQAYRAYHMIADMMLYAKPPDLQLEQTPLAQVVKRAVAEMMPQAQERQVQFKFRCDDVQAEVVGDAVQLAVAVRALVQNALEAVQRGGRVKLVVTSTGSQALICCQDSGPGLSAQARRHLFDPFYSGREAGRGLGFGLCKAWRIVTLHGGWIRADGRPGQGTTVQIGLPLAHTAAPLLTVLPAETPERARGAIRPAVLRIDDPDAA
jgi:signal transduction histidine kinase